MMAAKQAVDNGRIGKPFRCGYAIITGR